MIYLFSETITYPIPFLLFGIKRLLNSNHFSQWKTFSSSSRLPLSLGINSMIYHQRVIMYHLLHLGLCPRRGWSPYLPNCSLMRATHIHHLLCSKSSCWENDDTCSDFELAHLFTYFYSFLLVLTAFCSLGKYTRYMTAGN